MLDKKGEEYKVCACDRVRAEIINSLQVPVLNNANFKTLKLSHLLSKWYFKNAAGIDHNEINTIKGKVGFMSSEIKLIKFNILKWQPKMAGHKQAVLWSSYSL